MEEADPRKRRDGLHCICMAAVPSHGPISRLHMLFGLDSDPSISLSLPLRSSSTLLFKVQGLGNLN